MYEDVNNGAAKNVSMYDDIISVVNISLRQGSTR